MEAVDRATVLVIAKNSPIDVSYVVSPQQRAEQERERSIALVEESKRQKLRAEADRKAEALAKADEVRAKKEQQASEKRAREDAARKELRDREVSKSVANWKELVEDEMFSAWLKAQSSDMQSKFDSAKAVEVVSVFKRFQVERKEFSESYFRPGRVIKDCNDCPEMVIIPAGGFQMGSNSGGAEERPTHSVFVNSFAIGKYEVTQGQWNSVMGSNPSHFKDCGDTCPVEQVNWDDAQAFIQKLNQKSGRIYRLPSESEWEYACRAGATHTYCGSNVVDSVAVYDTNSGKKTQTVGSKQPNAWAIYDMSGNVWEWTQDCWNVNYKDAPKDGSVWARGDCSRHVLRGGSSYFIAGYSRAGFRDGYTSVGRNLTGFRVAKTLP